MTTWADTDLAILVNVIFYSTVFYYKWQEKGSVQPMRGCHLQTTACSLLGFYVSVIERSLENKHIHGGEELRQWTEVCRDCVIGRKYYERDP